jgi:hypothetical protein
MTPAETAAVEAIRQHLAGFGANLREAEFDNDRPAAWQTGWLDAYDLGQFAPIGFLRQNAEV